MAVTVSRGGRLSLIAGAVVGAIALGAWAGAAVATPDGGDSAELLVTAGPVEANASGQTYGSLAGYSDEEAPDLVLVELPDGTEGYVYSADLFEAEGPIAASPEEALASQEERTEGVAIAVYAVDGVTVVGEFVVGGDGYDNVPPVAEE